MRAEIPLREDVAKLSRTNPSESRDSDLRIIRNKFFSMLSLIFLLLGYFASVMYYESKIFIESEFASVSAKKFPLYVWLFLLGSTVFASIALFFRRLSAFQAGKKFRDERWIFSGHFIAMIFELCVTWVIPVESWSNIVFQNFNYEKNLVTFYKLNDLLTLAMNFRLIIVLDIILRNQKYSSLAMLKILEKYQIEINVLFILKCLMKKRPYTIFIWALLVSIFLFTYGIRICEMPLAIKLENSSFQSYVTIVWMVIITMTTVGYGDYTPKTIPGRILCFFLCIWGIFLMSLIVIILFQSLELNFEEKQALVTFNKLEAKKQLHESAVSLIGSWYRQKKGSRTLEVVEEHKRAFRSHRLDFVLNEHSGFDYFFEKVSMYLENMSENVQKLKSLKEELAQYHESHTGEAIKRFRAGNVNFFQDNESDIIV